MCFISDLPYCTKSILKKLFTGYSRVLCHFLGICKPYTLIVLVKCLFLEVFLHLLNCFANQFIGLQFAQRIVHGSNCINSDVYFLTDQQNGTIVFSK